MLFFYFLLIPFLVAGQQNPDNNSGDCRDKNAPGRSSDCPRVKSYCNNPIYKDLMADQCPATCKVGKCGEETKPNEGEDQENVTDEPITEENLQRSNKSPKKSVKRSKSRSIKTKSRNSKEGNKRLSNEKKLASHK